jgi:hypothetical protein
MKYKKIQDLRGDNFQFGELRGPMQKARPHRQSGSLFSISILPTCAKLSARKTGIKIRVGLFVPKGKN